MLFISFEDFVSKVNKTEKLNSESAEKLYKAMKNGDENAREALIEGYLYLVKAHILRMKPEMRTLRHVLECVRALGKAVDTFDFTSKSETFAHRLSFYLRNATTKYIVER
ncbi:MAG: hypothetical protein E7564_05655 [Ruminococcaceae bacterium]|nr:hypothetical protein [Oscillospiraceae bacterium]